MKCKVYILRKIKINIKISKCRLLKFLSIMLSVKRLDSSILFVSSPEHEVLKVSYCDRSMSVVRRPACVVRRQQFALKAYSCTPGPTDLKLCRKHQGDL